MKRTPLSEIISLAAKAAAPATAVATSLAAPLAQAAPGDLDPSFADHGRLAAILGAEGAVYSVEALDGGGAFVGGADLDFNGFCYFYYYCSLESSSFTDLLDDSGAPDAAYPQASIDGIEAFEFARQSDGKVVAAGRRIDRFRASNQQLVVFRLGTDGSLDTGFGEEGIFTWVPAEASRVQLGSSLVIDPNGGIVVAGARYVTVGDRTESRLVVLRLLADGSLDPSFGEAGIYSGDIAEFSSDVRIVRTNGGYRVAYIGAAGCMITGLDATGAVDATFGDGGFAVVKSAEGDPVRCGTLEVLGDGKLLVGGTAGDHGYVARLLANGADDPGFAADEALAQAMVQATSVRAAADGKVVIAGVGIKGASIMRLQATGELDTLFGDAGLTWIDLPSRDGSVPVVHDIAVGADGSVLAAGGDLQSDKPFAVRLLGDTGGASVGVLSIEQSAVDAAESGEALITVRRSGGKSGPVSVAYRTASIDSQAVAGQDYQELVGRLHWDDGETGERSIVIPVLVDSGAAEEYERFGVTLNGVAGGAAIGARNATVTIQPDGAPAGQFSIESYDPIAHESNVLQFWINRNYYYEGNVCVTLVPQSGTAVAGEDFDGDDSTYCWSDQDSESKLVEIAIVDDKEREETETFSVELSSPTGGAIIGPRGTASFAIQANDEPLPPPPSGGGGGSAGFLSLLLLGLAEAIHAARRRIRWPA